jgi:hypothetical protein
LKLVICSAFYTMERNGLGLQEKAWQPRFWTASLLIPSKREILALQLCMRPNNHPALLTKLQNPIRSKNTNSEFSAPHAEFQQPKVQRSMRKLQPSSGPFLSSHQSPRCDQHAPGSCSFFLRVPFCIKVVSLADIIVFACLHGFLFGRAVHFQPTD